MDIIVHGATHTLSAPSAIIVKRLTDVIPTIFMKTARPSIGQIFGERRVMMFRSVIRMDHGPMWITAHVETIISPYATSSQERIMNGGSGLIVPIIIIAIGPIRITLLLWGPIAIIPSGCNATISLIIPLHGSGQVALEVIITWFNGAIPEVHGMIFPVDRFREPGVM